MTKDLKPMTQKDCPKYPTCSANLCPLDPGHQSRTWVPGEDVCKSGEFRDLPWIKRQKKINRTRPQIVEGEALSYRYLLESSPVPRMMTEKQREALKVRQFKKAPPFKKAVS